MKWILTFGFFLLAPIALFSQDVYAGLPRTVDLTSQLTSIKDQGIRNTCSYFATMALIEAEFKRVNKKEYNFSEQYVNYHVNRMCHENKLEEDCQIGDISSLPNNASAINKFGLVQESLFPYQDSYTHQPSDTNIFKSAIQPKIIFNYISNFYTHSAVKPQTFKAMIVTYLAKEKKPLAFVFPLYGVGTDATNWDTTGRVSYSNDQVKAFVATFTTEQLDSIENDFGNPVDFHIAVICGYDLDKEIYLIRNSYGTSWGNNGYGTLPFKDFSEGVQMVYYLTMDSIPTDKLPEVEIQK